MARSDGTGNEAEAAGGTSAADDRGETPTGPSDTRLTELLRADTATSYTALQELRARHRAPVLAYARLCTTSETVARQLAGQAFTAAARETARGVDPGVPWRHRLLLLTTGLALSWAADERAAGLDPGLLLVLNTAGPKGPVPPMLAAFQSLPSRTQGLLWYGLVEQEPAARTAGFLGLRVQDVEYGVGQALQSMVQACLRTRLAASDDPRCGDFRRLIEESVRPDSPRYSADLHAHMAHCAYCTAAYEELAALRENPRGTLADGLLPWGGTAYIGNGTSEPLGAAVTTGRPAWPQNRRLALASAALGLALAPLVIFLLSSGGSPDQSAAGASVSPPAVPPAVTVTATVSVHPSTSPSASPTPTPTPTPKSPSPSRTSKPPKPTPKPTPTAHAPNGSFAQMVNTASGLCLEVAGDFDNGTDVVMVRCTSSPSQRWRVDSERGVVQSAADPDYCLDSRGSVYNGVGIWTCHSVYGSNGRNLRFAVGSDGVIRPAIAVETALTAHDDDSLSLDPLTGGADQRWRAGAP
jgi:hypothetical protein